MRAVVTWKTVVCALGVAILIGSAEGAAMGAVTLTPSSSVRVGGVERSLFSATTSHVSRAQLGKSWHPGCPVAPAQLRSIRMTYWGFDARVHVGRIIVNESVTTAVLRVFSTLFAHRFPIKEMIPQAAYGGNDNEAAALDDTSGFNCRYAVAPGPPHWSVHAYGEAIDVNDIQNPYVDGSLVIPPAGRAYLDRSDVRPGMAVYGGILVAAFTSVGWYWGGRWVDSPDYQHFSSTGG